ncbi:MAG: hypothetical protein JSS81_09495 [Acidobacteria bacterium]|nr:hypothetical protein [Acidobacteriota bacterium]
MLAILVLTLLAQSRMLGQNRTGQETGDGVKSADPVDQQKNDTQMEGVWEITVTFRNCETNEPLRTRPGLMSFFQGGMMQEFGTGSAPLDRSDAQGVWRHQNERKFASTAKAFRFAADGSYAGSLKFYRQIELGRGGNSLEATVRSEIFDANNILIGRGCATETGTRLE